MAKKLLKKLKKGTKPDAKHRRPTYREQALAHKTGEKVPHERGQKKNTQANRLLFIQTLRQTCNITQSARTVGITYGTANYWKAKKDLTVELEDGSVVPFAAAWNEALEEATDKLEEEARKWALEGIEEPVVYQGGMCWLTDPETGEIQRDKDNKPIPLTIPARSQRMMEILLKAHRPKFRDKPPPEGESGPSGVLIITMASNEDTWEKLAELQQRAHRESKEPE